MNQSKAKSDIPKSQNEENKILTLFTSQAVKILQNLLSNGWDRIYMTILIPLGHENKKLNGEKGTIFWQFVAVAHADLVSIWIQLNPVFSIRVCILLKLGPMRTGGNARLFSAALFEQGNRKQYICVRLMYSQIPLFNNFFIKNKLNGTIYRI